MFLKQLTLALLLFSSLQVSAYTSKSGYIEQGTWSGTVYVSDNVTINKDSVVNVAEGTVIKMGVGAKITVYGTFNFMGTTAGSIVVTSVNDNTIGENIALGGSEAAPGDWDIIEANGNLGGEMRITGVEFRYGGSANNAQVGFVYGASGTVTNSLFIDGFANGLRLYESKVIIDGCQFLQNGKNGIESVYYSEPIINGCSFIQNKENAVYLSSVILKSKFEGNTVTDNGTNGFRIKGIDAFSTRDTAHIYKNGDIAWVISGTSPVYQALYVYAGAVIKFDTNGKIYTGNAGGGKYGEIFFMGTMQDHVVLTSLKDDSVAGDTNNDADTTKPQKGDWDCLDILNGKGELAFFKLYYAGGSSNDALQYRNGASGSIKNGNVLFSAKNGIYSNTALNITNAVVSFNELNGIKIYGESAVVDLQNVTMEQNKAYGLSSYYYANPTLSYCYMRDNLLGAVEASSTLFTRPWTNNRAVTNGINGILVKSFSTKAPSTLYPTGDTQEALPFVLTSNIVSYPRLSINPGTVIKFQEGSYLYTSSSSFTEQGIYAMGTSENPVIFTSWKNDSILGDTNNDADATTPQAGDWKNVQVGHGKGIFRNAIFSYGGKNGSNQLSLTTSDTCIIDSCRFTKTANRNVEVRSVSKISHSTFMDATGSSVYVSTTGNKQSDINQCVFSYNVKGLEPSGSSNVKVRNTTFSNNQVGIYNYGNPDCGTDNSKNAGNNIFTMNSTYNFENKVSQTVYAVGNNWGTTIPAEIDATIYDDDENTSRGEVIFKLTSVLNPTFTVDIDSGLSPLQVQFTDNSTSSLSTIVKWYWDFNADGITDSEEQNPTHEFISQQMDSSFSVTLKVIDSFGDSAQMTKPDFITTSKCQADSLLPIMGDTLICKNITSSTYKLPEADVPGIMEYSIEPLAAGTINNTVSDHTFTINWDTEFSGQVKIYPMFTNNCGGIQKGAPLTVEVYPAQPEIGKIIQNGDTLIAPEGVAWQWYKNLLPVAGLIIIDDANEQAYVPETSGTYHVKVTNETGCQNEAEIAFVKLATQQISASKCTLYPNPVKASLNCTQTISGFSIYTLQGSLIQQQNGISTHKINTSHLANGAYMVHINSNGVTLHQIILKQ